MDARHEMPPGAFTLPLGARHVSLNANLDGPSYTALTDGSIFCDNSLGRAENWIYVTAGSLSLMERLELVLRRYQQLVPSAVAHADVPVRELGVWLREDVSHVLDEYTGRIAFRKYASWPIRTFRPGVTSPERVLVEQIDLELVECAKALVGLAQYKLIQRELQELFPPTKQVIREEVEIGEKGSKTLKREFEQYPQIEALHQQAQAIANHVGWSDLVNINDYLEPQQQRSTLEDGSRLQHAELIVALNPDLLPVGDFIVRSLLKRIELRFEALAKCRQMCLSALARIGEKYKHSREKLEGAWKQLSRHSEELIYRLRSGQDVRLRDASVAATQLYAAVHPRPDLDWLGLDKSTIDHGREMLRLRLKGLQNAHVFDRIAVTLGELQHLYTSHDSGRSEIEEAIAGGGLVIDEKKGEVHWEQSPVEVRSRGPVWKLLLALARKAQRGATVEISDVYGDRVVSDTAMTTTWSRLKNCFPASFHVHVRPGKKPRTYRLTLEPHLIHIFSAAKS